MMLKPFPIFLLRSRYTCLYSCCVSMIPEKGQIVREQYNKRIAHSGLVIL